jgi:hypothetical protein
MKRKAAAAVVLAACALASCGQNENETVTLINAPPPPPQAAATPPPDMSVDVAAAALTPKDQPNFRVCLAKWLDSDGAPLTVPAGAIFESWGRKNGDERNPTLDADMLKPGAIRYVVVLDQPITLSKATPCGVVIAQAAQSGLYEWFLPLTRNSLGLQFQVAGVENHMAFPVTGRLGEVVKKGAIFGYPTADIGNPRMLADED